MTNPLRLYDKYSKVLQIRQRKNELKLGEEIQFLNAEFTHENLQRTSAQFILIGIPEDIGVRANLGRAGAHTAWRPALGSLLNMQSNSYLQGLSILLLGEIETQDLMEHAIGLNPKSKNDLLQLQALVVELDKRVSKIITICVAAGKIPIVIGGGHNNSYGNLKGTSLALNQKINVINCDAHMDFRQTDGRHSGNGFSYAFEEGFINRYAAFCVHEQYNTNSVLHRLLKYNEHVYFNTYEDVFIRESLNFRKALQQCISFVKSTYCGVEIDLDSITNVPSSAKTSSGLLPIQARQFAYQCGNQLNATYFHIAEGAPVLSHIKTDNKTGKLIAYLICDFIKGVNERKEMN